jgi:fluoride exporter
MQSYLIIGIGGFLGAIARYLLAGWAAQRFGSEFPYGTLIINVSGCFVIGLFLTAITGRFAPPPELRLFFAVGFLGAYTTFSTFSFETLALLQSGSYLLAMANLVGSLALGMLAVTAGVFVARFI